MELQCFITLVTYSPVQYAIIKSSDITVCTVQLPVHTANLEQHKVAELSVDHTHNFGCSSLGRVDTCLDDTFQHIHAAHISKCDHTLIHMTKTCYYNAATLVADYHRSIQSSPPLDTVDMVLTHRHKNLTLITL
jgi:hypothetical protein